MSLQIKAASTTFTAMGLERFVPVTAEGFPVRGLQALHLFTEGSGTSLADSLDGVAGVIEHPIATNNAYSWLANGGLELAGTEIATFGAFDVTAPWTLVSCLSVVDSVGGTASERLAGLMGFRDWALGNLRGVLLYARGGTDWSGTSNAIFFQIRVPNGAGGQGTGLNLSPTSGMTVLDRYFVFTLNYNGTDTITATIYDKTGAILATGIATVSDALITTGSGGTIVTDLKPSLGGPNNGYSAGKVRYEAFGRYNKALSSSEVSAIINAGVALGAARGRPW